MILLHEHVSERAKLYCQHDPAIASHLYSELPQLLPGTCGRGYGPPCSRLAQLPTQFDHGVGPQMPRCGTKSNFPKFEAELAY